jgi:hypothetical protein
LTRLYVMVSTLLRPSVSLFYLTRSSTLLPQAISVESSFHDARFELEDCETQVQQTMDSLDHPESDRSLRPYAEIIKRLTEDFEFAFRSNSNKFRKVKAVAKQPVNEKSKLVALQARVKMAQLKVKSAERRWRNLLIEVKFLQVGMAHLSPPLFISRIGRVFLTILYDLKSQVGLVSVPILLPESKALMAAARLSPINFSSPMMLAASISGNIYLISSAVSCLSSVPLPVV